MHGHFVRQNAQLDAVDVEGGQRWLHTSHLRFETESLLCAAQEQVLAMNVMKAKVWKKGGTSLFRLCCKHDKTVMHIVSGYEMLAGTKYLYRHDHLGTYLHWLILKDRGFMVCDSWLKHKPLPTVMKGQITVYWYLPILTDKMVNFNKPDIVVWDAENQNAQLIDMSVPQDYNIVKVAAGKITKYKDLAIEL